jgi:predicted  nucleic acid-binding Zn-ribbon protein
MNTSESAAALEAELRVVEEDLAQLRQTAADLRRRIGEREDEPTDPAERAALIEAAEEQEALVDLLEARLEELMRQLRGINAPGSVRLTSRPRAAPGRSSTH